MKNKWRRNELLEGEIETENPQNPPKKRKIAPKRGPKSDSNGGDIFKGDSNGKNLSSNGEIKAHFLECDNIPEKDPQSIQKCDFSPKKDHIIDTNDSDDEKQAVDGEKQAVDGEKPSTVSVPFGCGPSNITMGGRSPPNLIKSQINCDLPTIARGGCSKTLPNSDSNCGQTNLTIVGFNKTTDFDYNSDTKCTPDLDIIDTKCNDSNGYSTSSDIQINTKCYWDPNTDVVPSKNSISDSNGRNLCDLVGQDKNEKVLYHRDIDSNKGGDHIDVK